MKALPLRLLPGDDLRAALQAVLQAQGCQAAFVLSGIGSLSLTRLRLAGAEDFHAIAGEVEILTLAGSLSPDGVHLHMSVADTTGRVVGGHVMAGCTVRTTAEVLLALLPEWQFRRGPDATTGYTELRINPK